MAITPINVSVSNATGTVALSASGLPTGLTFTDNGNGTGDITGTVAAGQADNSPFTVTITATDDVATDDETFLLTVEPPALKPNVAGLANINSASQVLDNFDLKTLTTVATGYYGAVEIGHNILWFMSKNSNAVVGAAVDVSDPANPVVLTGDDQTISGITDTPRQWDVDVANQRMYVASSSRVYSLDISNPSAITLLNTSPAFTNVTTHGLLYTGAAVVRIGGGNDVQFTVLSPDLSTVLYDQNIDGAIGSNGLDFVGCAAKGNNVWFSVFDSLTIKGLVRANLDDPTSPVFTDLGQQGSAGQPFVVFLPGTGSGDVVAYGSDSVNDTINIFEATGSETSGTAEIALLDTNVNRNATYWDAQKNAIADTNNVLYIAAETRVQVIDASAPATALVVDNNLIPATGPGVDWVALTDQKVVAGDDEFFSIWT